MRIVAAAVALGIIAGMVVSMRAPAMAATLPAEPPLTRYDVPLPDELQQYIILECAAAEPPVPVEIVLAVIEHESGFDPDAVGYNDNGTSDHGLMQINSGNHEWLEIELGVTDMHDPHQNITAGVYILSMLLEDERSVNDALMAYQCGQARARELRRMGRTSTRFSRWVMERARCIENEDRSH